MVLKLSVYLKKARAVLLLMLFLFYVQSISAQNQKSGSESIVDSTKSNFPSLSEVVPMASELDGKYASLNTEIDLLLDQAQVKDDFSKLNEALKVPQNKLDELIKDKKVRIDRLIELKKTVDNQNETFQNISQPLQVAIDDLNQQREKWLKEKQKWHSWESEILKEGDLSELKLTFSQTQLTIKNALDRIVLKLSGLLKLQKTGYKEKAKIIDLETQLDSLIQDQRHNVFLDASPPMFSTQYTAQFSHELWSGFSGGIKNVNWFNYQLLENFWWIFLIQIFVSIITLVYIYKKEKIILGFAHYSFIARRPIAVSLFFGLMASFAFYELAKIPNSLLLLHTIVGGFSFISIISAMAIDSWKKHFVYGLIVLLIFSRVFNFINLPIPLNRIFVLVSSLIGAFYSFRNAITIKHKNIGIHLWGSYIVVLLLSVIIIISELLGKEGLAHYIFESTLRSLSTIIVYMLFIYLIHGGVKWLFKGSAKYSHKVSYDDIQRDINRTLFIVDLFFIIFILIPMNLGIWGVYESFNDATIGFLELGFNIGSFKLTVGLIIASVSIIYIARFISIISQKIFMSKVFDKKNVEEGARLSINRLLNYFIMSIGFLLAISAFGFEITKVTIVLSALGIGIGFGLQGIVNNFVSGLILLFDRPVREGDQIQVGEVWSTIKKIGLRATRVETADEADLIIPNADLVYNQVINWTLSDRHIRIKIDIGVAYGSDVALVIKTLIDTAQANSRLVKNHPPQVLFLGFGENSLDFQLRVWGTDVDSRMVTHSELNQDIDKRFREANIEIAFPQQDIHLKSIDKSITLKPKEPDKE